MTSAFVMQKAEAIAKKYNQDRLAPFPFENIEEAYSDLNIHLVEMDAEVSGAIVYRKKDSEFDLLINKNKPIKRQYFTIAHEIGHYFLHQDLIKKKDFLVDSDDEVSSDSMLYRLDQSPSTKVEAEANRFAAALLMPSDLVEKAWELMQNPQECADLFQVSLSAMSIRLEALDLISVN